MDDERTGAPMPGERALVKPLEPAIAVGDLVVFAIHRVHEATRFVERGPIEAWRQWAEQWLSGRDRTPAGATDAANLCFSQRMDAFEGSPIDPVFHALGQIAWAAKEAYYAKDNPVASWLVLRYVADAAIAFNVPLTKESFRVLAPDDNAVLPGELATRSLPRV